MAACSSNSLYFAPSSLPPLLSTLQAPTCIAPPLLLTSLVAVRLNPWSPTGLRVPAAAAAGRAVLAPAAAAPHGPVLPVAAAPAPLAPAAAEAGVPGQLAAAAVLVPVAAGARALTALAARGLQAQSMLVLAAAALAGWRLQ